MVCHLYLLGHTCDPLVYRPGTDNSTHQHLRHSQLPCRIASAVECSIVWETRTDHRQTVNWYTEEVDMIAVHPRLRHSLFGNHRPTGEEYLKFVNFSGVRRKRTEMWPDSKLTSSVFAPKVSGTAGSVSRAGQGSVGRRGKKRRE